MSDRNKGATHNTQQDWTRMPDRLLVCGFTWSLVMVPLMILLSGGGIHLSCLASGAGSLTDDILWLQQLYQSANGSAWTDQSGSCTTGWNMTPGSSLTCFPNGSTSWHLIFCKNNRVVKMSLWHCKINGTLPEFTNGAMSQLESLDLNQNSLRGTLPESIGGIRGLVRVRLFGNNFSGTIPPSFRNLSRLEVFDVSNNQLDGTLPDFLQHLTQLRELHLYINRFIGTLPSSWSQMTRLSNLTFFSNSLSGNLPAAWASLGHITMLVGFSNCLNTSRSHWMGESEWNWWRQWLNPFGFGNQLSNCSPWCPTGQLLLNGTNSMCYDCPMGYYCPNIAAIEAVPCPVGTYNPLTSQQSCKACANGTTTTGSRETSQQACVPIVEEEVGEHTPTMNAIGGAVAVAGVLGAMLVETNALSLDLVMMGAIQQVPCSEVLRRGSDTTSSATSSSPLRYVLSPFMDFGSAMSALGSAGVVVAALVAQGTMVAVLSERQRIDLDVKVAGWPPSSWSRGAMTSVLFPGVSFTIFAMLAPGMVRGALTAAMPTTGKGPDTPRTAAAVACTVAVLCSGAAGWVVVVRWCASKWHVTYNVRRPMRWVSIIRAELPAFVPWQFLLPRGEWHPRTVQRRAGVLFASVKGLGRRWVPGGFVLQSVTFVAVSSAPVAVYDVDGCMVLHATLSVLAMVPVVVAALCRFPYRIGVVNVLTVINSCFLSATAAITAAALQHHSDDVAWSDSAMRVVDGLAAAQYSVAALRTLLLLLLKGLEWYALRIELSTSTNEDKEHGVTKDDEASRHRRRSRLLLPTHLKQQTELPRHNGPTFSRLHRVSGATRETQLAALISAACCATDHNHP